MSDLSTLLRTVIVSMRTTYGTHRTEVPDSLYDCVIAHESQLIELGFDVYIYPDVNPTFGGSHMHAELLWEGNTVDTKNVELFATLLKKV